MGEKRGSIAFCSTYRPPVALDIYSCPIPPNSKQDELRITDAVSSNYNAQFIPPASLKTMILNLNLKHPNLASDEQVKDSDVDSGRISGIVFVSERSNHLETLHIALCSNINSVPKVVKVFNLGDVFGISKFNNGVRMEDSGCFAGDYLVYVSTVEPADDRRQPWTAVYKTNLKTAKTQRLTPKGVADLSPSVSPSGKMIAVASFERQGGWHGEIENLKTDIFVMNVDGSLNRKLVIENGGWPTWGSDDILFFHRKVGDFWGVFRADISNGHITRVTPDGVDAITPAAMNATTVAVATIRQKSKLSKFSDVHVEAQCRHIEIFDTTGRQQPLQITRVTKPKVDHYNPFVIVDKVNGEMRIGYHRCRNDSLKREEEVPKQLHKVRSPFEDVGLFRVSGVFPSFSKDGSKLAFVDNSFKAVWVADDQGLRPVFEAGSESDDQIFCPVWNQNPEMDILYVCMGPSFHANQELHLHAVPNASSGDQDHKPLTKAFNNFSPSTNPDGTKLVFRSTRDGGEKRYKNLYIMDAISGEYARGGGITRLTKGDWVDTQCHWSPRGDWIVFSSNRDKPKDAPELDHGLDPGYFMVYLVKAYDPSVVVRVLGSGLNGAGHVNHPIFSPDGKSIVVTSDLAGLSVDPISLPLFLHSVRPYGDIFTVDINPDDIYKNKDVKKFNRITHSRYENSTPSWTNFSTQDPKAAWNIQFNKSYNPQGGKHWHLSISKTRC